jgi:hypothetical protein
MFAEFFAARSGLMVWPLIGLIILVAAFTAVMLRVLFGLRDPRKRDRLASLPLADEGVPNGDTARRKG